jgi:hypothetical protein
MPDHAVIPVPPAAANPRGWTVYQHGAVVGWVRLCDDAETDRTPAAFFAIPRVGPGDRRDYASPADAGAALIRNPRGGGDG